MHTRKTRNPRNPIPHPRNPTKKRNLPIVQDLTKILHCLERQINTSKSVTYVSSFSYMGDEIYELLEKHIL